jgi:hypothetical protein
VKVRPDVSRDLAIQMNAVISDPHWREFLRRVREHQWPESVATNDASVVNRILADDFIWVLDGKVLNKATAVRFAKQEPGDFISNHAHYVHVRFFGEHTAVAQGSET